MVGCNGLKAGGTTVPTIHARLYPAHPLSLCAPAGATPNSPLHMEVSCGGGVDQWPFAVAAAGVYDDGVEMMGAW